MNVIRKALILIGAVVVAAALNSGIVAARPQTDIEKEVAKKILRLPYYEVFDVISFTVDDEGTVTLYGKVRNAINRPSAESAVKRVPGVKKVVNNIQLLPVSRYDDELRRRLYRSITRTADLYRYFLPVNPPVRLIVERGHITLEGNVATRGDSNLMNIAANSVSGAFSVTNNLKIEKSTP